jgi:hypothetical protein
MEQRARTHFDAESGHVQQSIQFGLSHMLNRGRTSKSWAAQAVGLLSTGAILQLNHAAGRSNMHPSHPGGPRYSSAPSELVSVRGPAHLIQVRQPEQRRAICELLQSDEGHVGGQLRALPQTREAGAVGLEPRNGAATCL